jgi:hypothetical protein
MAKKLFRRCLKSGVYVKTGVLGAVFGLEAVVLSLGLWTDKIR